MRGGGIEGMVGTNHVEGDVVQLYVVRDRFPPIHCEHNTIAAPLHELVHYEKFGDV
jgi:hypothetical protein